MLSHSLIVIAVLALTATIFAANSSAAQPVLAARPDVVGESLQRTMIWGPPVVKNRSDFAAFRKSLTLETVPDAATLHLFADVRYILWINGEPVLRGPARFETRGPEYDTIDVARSLRTGENSIVVLVMGNGSNARMMRHAPGLTLRLDIAGRTVLGTDETWKWSDQTRYRPASVNWAHIMDRIDARVEDGDWTKGEYDDRGWKSASPIDGGTWGPLSARRTPLLRDTPLEPRLPEGVSFPVTLESGQKLTFGMGRLVQAYTVLELEADAGTQLDLDYGKIQYVAKAGRQTYISSDTYAFDGGSVAVKSGRATIRSLKLVERLYPFDRVGSFKSSDPLLDRLWAVCARSLEIMSEDAYVDCSDRERAEWMDCDPPVFDITRTAMSSPGQDGKPIYADARLLGAMLRRTALTQQPDGWVKAHTTSDRFDIHAHMEDRSCDWVQGARRYYDSTGDAKIIREIWPVIVTQMNYFLKNRTERGLVRAREWVIWGNPIGYVTCEGAGLNAFVYKALVDAAYLGEAIGEKEQGAKFDEAAVALAKAFNAVLWNDSAGAYFSGHYTEADRAKADGEAKKMKLKVENDLIETTVFPALFALDQGIVPADRRDRVTAFLHENRKQEAQIMGFYYLWLQLYRADTDAFDREILRTMRERWKPQAESKWGTSWEDFRGWSKAHCYGMFPGYFLSAYVLGVRIDGPVWNKSILIEPRLGDLTFAEGVVVTEHGPVTASWKLENEKLAFTLQVPPGIRAKLRVPKPTDDAVLTLNGKRASGAPAGRYLAIEIGGGSHEGSVGNSE